MILLPRSGLSSIDSMDWEPLWIAIHLKHSTSFDYRKIEDIVQMMRDYVAPDTLSQEAEAQLADRYLEWRRRQS